MALGEGSVYPTTPVRFPYLDSQIASLREPTLFRKGAPEYSNRLQSMRMATPPKFLMPGLFYVYLKTVKP